MPRFAQEPPFKHGSVASAAILLVNLGTPEAPTATAVRRYLKQFLGDRAWWRFTRRLAGRSCTASF